MIRDLLVAIVFFFGPMLLLFVLRNLGPLIRLWLAVRRQRRAQPDIIDVSPKSGGGPSPGFVAIAILAGVLSAYWAWHYTRQGGGESRDMQYVPAYLDSHGHLVPGRLVPRKPGPPDTGASSAAE